MTVQLRHKATGAVMAVGDTIAAELDMTDWEPVGDDTTDAVEPKKSRSKAT